MWKGVLSRDKICPLSLEGKSLFDMEKCVLQHHRLPLRFGLMGSGKRTSKSDLNLARLCGS